jgi:hypothetical protein
MSWVTHRALCDLYVIRVYRVGRRCTYIKARWWARLMGEVEGRG